jgi:glycosyltransferase involved in cell wall biosynthesis
MKITILSGPSFPVPALRGGAMQKSWHGLARELAKLGQDVTIVARSYPGQAREELLDGVRFRRAGGFAQGSHLGWNLSKDFIYALRILWRLPQADILVTNDFWTPALAARFRRAAGAVIISAGRYPKRQYGLYRGAARVIAISSAVREMIVEEQPILADRAVVIPLPVDLGQFRPRIPQLPSANRTLLYAGRIHPEKGLELLVGAFARISERFPDWRLKVVGPARVAEGGGGPAFSAELKERSKDLRIDWCEAVWDPGALAAVYSSADLFCYPSLAERGEAFGVAALESMAAGVPPIVSNLACFRDFVRHGENAWVFDHLGRGAEEALAGALATAMENGLERARVGQEARNEAEKYGFREIATRYLLEFERVASSAHRG